DLRHGQVGIQLQGPAKILLGPVQLAEAKEREARQDQRAWRHRIQLHGALKITQGILGPALHDIGDADGDRCRYRLVVRQEYFLSLCACLFEASLPEQGVGVEQLMPFALCQPTYLQVPFRHSDPWIRTGIPSYAADVHSPLIDNVTNFSLIPSWAFNQLKS